MLSLAMVGAVKAAGPDDQYLEIYNLIQQADGISNDAKTAAAQYGQAQAGLKKLQSFYPTWNKDVVDFRIGYVNDKLAALAKDLPQPAPAVVAAPAKTETPAVAMAAAEASKNDQQVADLTDQVRALTSAKTALEAKLKEALSVQPAPVDPKLDEEILNLKKEKDLLNAALQQKSTAGDDQVVAQLRARLAVLEAKPDPYTAEELALMKPVQARPVAEAAVPTSPPAPKRVVRSLKDLPPGAGAMMAEAQRAFVTGDFVTAEKKYSEVLNQDSKNVYVLSHIANAQLAAGHLDDCAKNVQTALSVDPDDAASLFLLGNLRMRQNKLDEALDALSHSAAINPTNATTQNSLGSVLSQKGMRQAAETALRKALQLDPVFPEAHFNLAIVYATQTPPFMELARWHYKKAQDLGYPKNPEIEKLLEAK